MRYRRLSWKQVLHYTPKTRNIVGWQPKPMSFSELEDMAKRLDYMFFVWEGRVYETGGTVTETQLDIDVT